MNLDIADMQEVYAAHFPKFTNDVGNIILTIGTEGTGTNRKSITFTVDHLSNLLEVTFVFDDTGQTKDGNRRIIGMNAHFNADFFSNRYDSLEEVFQVLAQAIFIHAIILFNEMRQSFQPFRLPPRKDKAVGVVQNFSSHIVRCFPGNEMVVISKNGRAIV